MDYHSVIKKNEILPFAAKWMELNIMLSEISQTKKGNYHVSSLKCGS